MKSTSSTTSSALTSPVRGECGQTGPGAAVVGSAALAPVVFAHKGRIVREPAAKAPRRVAVDLPGRIVRALLVVPEVLREIELRERLAIVRAANVLISRGVSQKQSARALGVAASQLSVWRERLATLGEESLRPLPSGSGRPAANGLQKRRTAFLELKLAGR